MSDRTRVLVLGGTGMLGHEIVRVFADDFEVHASVRDVDRARTFALPAILHHLDAEREDHLGGLLERTAPHAVVNCIGLVKQRKEGSQSLHAISMNSLFPLRLAEACANSGVRLVHLSTDCVFSGHLPAPGRYDEDSLPDPVDLYGRSKLLGEVTSGDALTIRTSMIGWELGRPSGLLEWFVAQAGREVQGFTNAVFSGLTTHALAHVLRRVVKDHPGLRGLYHVASLAPISKYQLLTALDDILRLRCIVKPQSEPRINRALDPSRFVAATGMEMPSWPEMLDEYRKETNDTVAR